MKKVFAIISFILPTLSFAQEEKVLIPTPESSSLIKWSQNEVNYSSGALNTQIPIYTLKDGDLSVPISLHYNGSSGIKADEAATWVGLGWDLVAGGKIVRVVRDKPDEAYTMNYEVNEKSKWFQGFSLGAAESPFQLAKISLDYQSDKVIYRGGWYINGFQEDTPDFIDGDPALFDTEPDLFIVNLDGDIIKFVFDRYKNPVIINNKDYKIDVVWSKYNPTEFYSKQDWSIDARVAINGFAGKSDGSIASLSATLGLNQFFRKDKSIPDVIGFKEWVITKSDGTKYFFGGSRAYLEFNFDDQSFLSEINRLAIAVTNLGQMIPSAWSLRKIQSPNGTKGSENKIEFTYKRTHYYEHYHSSEDVVNPSSPCDSPNSSLERYKTNFNASYGLLGWGISFSAPSPQDLNAYVTLNTRVVYGTLLKEIISPNYKIVFNSDVLANKEIDSLQISKIISGFKSKDFKDTLRVDLQFEKSLSSQEERDKFNIGINPITGGIDLNFNDWTGTIPIYHVPFIGAKPSVSYNNGNFAASLVFDGSSVAIGVSQTGEVYKVDLERKYYKLLDPHIKLRNIEIIDFSTDKRKAFYFDYDYFKSNYSSQPLSFISFLNCTDLGLFSDLPKNYYGQLHNKYLNEANNDLVRLKLKGFYELKYNSNKIEILPGYEFKYDSTVNVPRRLTFAVDHWGYYNGEHDNRNKTQFISRMSYKIKNNMGNIIVEDGDLVCPLSSNRLSNYQYAKMGILEKIIYPTGGSKKFEYELHSVNNFSKKIGGLRIKKISTLEPVSSKNNIQVMNYLDTDNKSSGKLAVIPDYYFSHNGTIPKVVLSNHYNYLISTFINDGPVSYKRVIVKDSSNGIINGYTEHLFNNEEYPSTMSFPIYQQSVFSNSENGPDTFDRIQKMEEDVECPTCDQSGTYQNNRFFKLKDKPLYDYTKNSIKGINVYNNSNKLIKKTEYLYSDLNNPNFPPLIINASNCISRFPIFKVTVGTDWGLIFNPVTIVWPTVKRDVRIVTEKSAIPYPYQLKILRYDLLTEKETIWDVNGENPITSEKTYKYSFYHHNPVEISQLNSKGQQITNLVKYSLDLDNFPKDTLGPSDLNDFTLKIDSDINKTVQSKYLNIPIEEISIIDSMVVAAKITEIYTSENPSNKNGLPKAEHILEIDAPIPYKQFHPLTFKAYSGEYYDPVTDTYSDGYVFRYAADERYVPRLFVSEYNSKGLPTKFNKVGDPITKVDYGFNDLIPISKTVAFDTPLARTTFYNYTPLYGLTQVTNPNGTKLIYEYDSIGRLKLIRDQHNEILKSYMYKILGF